MCSIVLLFFLFEVPTTLLQEKRTSIDNKRVEDLNHNENCDDTMMMAMKTQAKV